MKTEKQTISLENITLMDLRFSLGNFTVEHSDKIRMNINAISPKVEEIDKEFSTILMVTLLHSDFENFKVAIRVKGNFEIDGELDFKLEDFMNINAPAIIYPYIRQIIRHTSLESNQPIILPVVDFVALHIAKNKES